MPEEGIKKQNNIKCEVLICHNVRSYGELDFSCFILSVVLTSFRIFLGATDVSHAIHIICLKLVIVGSELVKCFVAMETECVIRRKCNR